jgi:FkbM family methyltransferase
MHTQLTQTVPTASSNKNRALAFSLPAFVVWLVLRPLKLLRPRAERYRVISPSYSPLQKIFDTQTRETFTLTIRDRIDLAVVHQIFYSEDYRLRRLKRHRELYDQYRSMCDANVTPLIVDLGANTGLASLYFAREFPKARIVAVEPDIENIAMARENNRGNGNVQILQSGISSIDGRGAIANAGDENWAYRTEAREDGELTMVSMNTLLSKHVSEHVKPFIVKIDIEGFEENLFSASTEWVDEFPLLIIELHDWMLPGSASSRPFLKCVSQLNRDFNYNGENIFSIKNH